MYTTLTITVSLIALGIALTSSLCASINSEEEKLTASSQFSQAQERTDQDLTEIPQLGSFIKNDNLEIPPQNVKALLNYSHVYAAAFQQYNKGVVVKDWNWDDIFARKDSSLVRLLHAFTHLTRFQLSLKPPLDRLAIVLAKTVQFYPYLQHLDLSHCHLNEDEIETILKSLKAANEASHPLAELDLRGNSLSLALKDKYQNAFPNLTTFMHDLFEEEKTADSSLNNNNALKEQKGIQPFNASVSPPFQQTASQYNTGVSQQKPTDAKETIAPPSAIYIPTPSSYGEQLKGKEEQKKALAGYGLTVNEDNVAVRFLSVEELCQRLKENAHGRELDLSSSSFRKGGLEPILNTLSQAQSILKLNLANSILTVEHYATLTSVLAQNSTLQELDLTQTAWPEGAFETLLTGLKLNKGLSFLKLQPINVNFTRKEIEQFYESLKGTRTLRFVMWPESKELIKTLETLAKSNILAALHLGVMYREGLYMSQDLKKAVDYLQKSASLGHPIASHELGSLSEQTDPRKAFTHYTTAANQGYAAAEYALARYYRREWGKWSDQELNHPDYDQTFTYCKRAADKGYAEAQYRFARMYEDGRSVPKNPTLAEDYFKRAATQGHYGALRALGGMHAARGDKEKAERYLKIAQVFDPAAKRFLVQLQKEQKQ